MLLTDRWKVIVDNLMTQDKVTFRDLLSRLHYPTATGVNIFSSLEYVSVVLCSHSMSRLSHTYSRTLEWGQVSVINSMASPIVAWGGCGHSHHICDHSQDLDWGFDD